jgi:hypothetical protein
MDWVILSTGVQTFLGFLQALFTYYFKHDDTEKAFYVILTLIPGVLTLFIIYELATYHGRKMELSRPQSEVKIKSHQPAIDGWLTAGDKRGADALVEL